MKHAQKKLGEHYTCIYFNKANWITLLSPTGPSLFDKNVRCFAVTGTIIVKDKVRTSSKPCPDLGHCVSFIENQER